MNTSEQKRDKSSDQRYLDVLDLEERASPEEIERQYRRLRNLYSPDRLDDQEDRAYAQAKLDELEEAYAALREAVESSDSRNNFQPAGNVTDDDEADPESDLLYCANHPRRETLLRCNKCGKPICMDCAVQTPVGYRCKECVYEQQNVYYTAATRDNLIAFVVGFIITAIGAPIVGLLIGGLGFFFGLLIAIFIGSGAGSVLAQIIRRAVGGRRGRKLPLFALGGIILGVLLGNLVFALFFGGFPLLSPPMLLFTALAIGAAYPQLR